MQEGWRRGRCLRAALPPLPQAPTALTPLTLTASAMAAQSGHCAGERDGLRSGGALRSGRRSGSEPLQGAQLLFQAPWR